MKAQRTQQVAFGKIRATFEGRSSQTAVVKHVTEGPFQVLPALAQERLAARTVDRSARPLQDRFILRASILASPARLRIATTARIPQLCSCAISAKAK